MIVLYVYLAGVLITYLVMNPPWQWGSPKDTKDGLFPAGEVAITWPVFFVFALVIGVLLLYILITDWIKA